MSAPPQAMRAVARAAVEAPRDRAAPPILLPRRRPGHLGPLHITQLLLAEVVLVAVAATLTRSAVAAAGVALVGAVLLLFALGRREGRWWLEQRLMARRYRRRRRDTAGMPYGVDPRLAALRRLAPGLVVNDVAVADGAQVGVARDDAGWYAVAALTPNPPGRDDPGGVPLDVIAAALAEAEQPGAVLQVVTRTVPAPSVKIHPSSPAGQSYRRLLSRFGAPVPADRDTWVAVRLEARMLAEAVTDAGADLDAVPAVVAALVRRVARSLRHVGVRHRLLDADALLDALVRSCDLEPPSPPELREDWSAWHSSRLAHRSFWIRGWPAPAQAGGLLNWLSTAAAAMTSVALVIVPDEDPQLVDLRALVRVAAPEGDLAAACQALTDGARQAGADLFPLDGEQGPAVYASAPTGGGAR